MCMLTACSGSPPQCSTFSGQIQPHTRLVFEFGVLLPLCQFNILATWNAALGENSTRPRPSSAHAFVKFDQYRAVFYGGRYMQEGWIHYSSDLFVLNSDERVRFLHTYYIHR